MGDETLIQDDIELSVKGVERHFAVRITRESSKDHEYGFVLTFDDTTELVRAQRSSAWADVAQRIAHEMKNPLTPIQLSAERVRRKYGPVIGKDRAVLDECTETISWARRRYQTYGGRIFRICADAGSGDGTL